MEIEQTLVDKQHLANTKEQELRSGWIKNNKDSQSRLTSLLLICFDTLDTFGKEPEQLKNLEVMFQMVLGRFTIDAVTEAFSQYMETKTVMPKPADIVRIIEPPKVERKWCAVTFIDLQRQQREGQFMTKAETQYMHDFKAAKVQEPDSAPMIEDAMQQAALQDKKYWIAN